MPLETAVGAADADSYGDLAAFQTYATDLGWDLTSYTDTVQEQELRRATQYLDRKYNWKGLAVTRTQALGWPRAVEDADRNGYSIPSDSIPQPIIDAQFELAFAFLGGVDPLATLTTGTVKRKKVMAPGGAGVETEYVGGGRAVPSFPQLGNLLSDYIKGGAGGRRLVRA